MSEACPQRALFLHTVGDGLGDELARADLFAVLRANRPETRIVVASRRPHLYAAEAADVVALAPVRPGVGDARDAEQGALADLARESWDLVLCARRLDRGEEEPLPRFERAAAVVTLPGFPEKFWSAGLARGGLRERIEGSGNVYDLMRRVAMALDFDPDRRDRSLFVDQRGPARARARPWLDLARGRRTDRPVLVVAPFGGSHPAKGLQDLDAVTTLLGALGARNCGLLVVPASGSREDLLRRLAVCDPPLAHVLPCPEEEPDLVCHVLHLADGAVCVEGGLMHLCFALARPALVLIPTGTPEGAFALACMVPRHACARQRYVVIDNGFRGLQREDFEVVAEEALRTLGAGQPPQPSLRSRSLDDAGRGTLDDAAFARGVGALEQHLGPAHPSVAEVFSVRARLLAHVGRSDEAIEHARRALVIRVEAHGPASPLVARALHDVAGLVEMRVARCVSPGEASSRA